MSQQQEFFDLVRSKYEQALGRVYTEPYNIEAALNGSDYFSFVATKRDGSSKSSEFRITEAISGRVLVTKVRDGVVVDQADGRWGEDPIELAIINATREAEKGNLIPLKIPV